MLESKQRQIAEAERLPIPTVQAIIDGKLTGAASGKTLAIVSPIDGKTVAAIPDCETPDIDRAVAGARKAFESRRWQGMSPKQRKRIVLDWADRVLNRDRGLVGPLFLSIFAREFSLSCD
jgi:acyl-CoA reductase-like NAD-dependent aldehyde dehydrogenase